MTQKLTELPARFRLLVEKAPKDLNKSELAIMADLSHYNYWLAEARANAAELAKYEKLLETANFMVNKKDLEYVIKNRKSAILVCLAKAEAAKKQAFLTEELQKKLEEERKAKKEAERKAFKEKKKAETEDHKAMDKPVEIMEENTEDSEEPAA